MSLTLLLICVATFLSTLLGGFFSLYLKDRQHLILGFSAGAILGVAFFDLIPEAFELVGETHDFSFVALLLALGFALYMVLDRLVVLHSDADDGHTHSHRGIFGAGSLSLHSLIDGIGVGLAFQVSPTVGAIVAVAVLAHSFSDGINTVSLILKNGGNRARAFLWLGVDALAPTIGILMTFLFSVSESQLGLLIALFSGSFLYVGASDLLPESHHAHPVRFTTIMTLFGMAFVYAIVSLAQGLHA